jgi:hypothetical protein
MALCKMFDKPGYVESFRKFEVSNQFQNAKEFGNKIENRILK